MRFDDGRHTAAGMTQDEALEKRAGWRGYRKAGVTPAIADTAKVTVGAAADRTYLAAERRDLDARSLEHWRRKLQPWRTAAMHALPVEYLRVREVEDWYHARHAEAPKTAADQLAGLKATLRTAQRDRAAIDQAILDLRPKKPHTRRRLALSPDELWLLATASPRYGRMFLLAGTTGLRPRELYELDQSEVDLAARTITLE